MNTKLFLSVAKILLALSVLSCVICPLPAVAKPIVEPGFPQDDPTRIISEQPAAIETLPVAVDDLYATALDTTLIVSASQGVLANDLNPDQLALTTLLVEDVSAGVLVFRQDGSFNYKPPQGFTGTMTFTYRIYDGANLSSPASVSIDVNQGNHSPVATADRYEMVSNVTLTIDAAAGLLANDRDVDVGDILTAELIGGVAFGSLKLNPDGSFEYKPDPQFIGEDHFTYLASDGKDDSIPAMVTVVVNLNPNRAPVAVGDAYLVTAGTTLAVGAEAGVLVNDTDMNGDALTAELVSSVACGCLALNPDGSFSYTPQADYFGFDQFTYDAYDGQLTSNMGTVTLLVLPPNKIFLPSVLR